MNLESLIEKYGYLALVVGTFLEGETILLMAGFVANRGYLTLQGVILCAFVGSTLGDQTCFYIGRRKGRAYFARRLETSERAHRLMARFERYQISVVLSFRFIYGLRNITPLLIGASGFSPRRFLVLNAVTAAIWSIVVGTLGYLFGHAMEHVFQDIKRYEQYVLAALAVGGTSIWVVLALRQRRKSRCPSDAE